MATTRRRLKEFMRSERGWWEAGKVEEQTSIKLIIPLAFFGGWESHKALVGVPGLRAARAFLSLRAEASLLAHTGKK